MKRIMKSIKILLPVFLCLALALNLPPSTVLADGTYGGLTVTGGNGNIDYTYSNDELTILTSAPMTLSGTTTVTRVVIAPNVTANITLENAIIDVSGTSNACAFHIGSDATAHITLSGANTLKSGTYEAGLSCPDGTELTIGGTGSLTATSASGGAGIGGSITDDVGKITINSGDITATGGNSGAGIGGGSHHDGGETTISGGTVTATGGPGSAGIGGGFNGKGGEITISGGTVTATGGDGGAGIGGGLGDSGGNITISGGTVYAQGFFAQDIGGGADSSSGSLEISGMAAVFLKNDDCLTPTPPNSHVHVDITSDKITDDKAYGVPVLDTWSAPYGAYLILYTLNYDKNDGDGTPPESVTQHIGTTVTVEDGSGLTRTGYTFWHWNTDKNNAPGGTSYHVGNTFIFTANTTVYAQWTPETYTIDYALAGGVVDPTTPNPDSYTLKSADITLNDPTRTGYTFAGWSGTDITGTSTTVTIPAGSTGNRSYTAHWTPVPYDITYNLNNGEVDPANPNPGSYNAENNITLNNPVRTGYVFTGWSGTDITGTQLTVTIPAGSTGDRNYTAHWELAGYSITYDLDDGAVIPSNPSSYAITSVITLNNPTRTGYVFAGWSGTDITGTLLTVTIPAGSTGDRSYTAHWAPVPYAITYILDGGEVDPAHPNPGGYNIENNITLNNPVRTGYVFTGWSGTDITGTQLTVTIPAGSTGDRNYTANWRELVSGLPLAYTMGVGDKVTWDPSPDGDWDWDASFFSATFNSPATFTALKAGTSTITYTALNGSMQDVIVTIKAPTGLDDIPHTGDGDALWIWLVLIALSAAGIITLGLSKFMKSFLSQIRGR